MRTTAVQRKNITCTSIISTLVDSTPDSVQWQGVRKRCLRILPSKI